MKNQMKKPDFCTAQGWLLGKQKHAVAKYFKWFLVALMWTAASPDLHAQLMDGYPTGLYNLKVGRDELVICDSVSGYTLGSRTFLGPTSIIFYDVKGKDVDRYRVGRTVLLHCARTDYPDHARVATGVITVVNIISPTICDLTIDFIDLAKFNTVWLTMGPYPGPFNLNKLGPELTIVQGIQAKRIELEEGGTISVSTHQGIVSIRTHGRGGVGLITADTIYCKGGSIDVSGCGIDVNTTIANSYLLASRGKGGAGGLFYNGGGPNGAEQNNDTLCMQPWFSGCKGSDGTQGDNAAQMGSMGQSLAGQYVRSQNEHYKDIPAQSDFNSNFNPVIIMGHNIVDSLSRSGGGGQGGGHGGMGGDACGGVNFGNTGNKGEDGNEGNTMLGWARGGGAVIIKVKQVVFVNPPNPVKPVFIANGEDGFDGACGGNGGLGGDGGSGGKGMCNAGSILHSGGNGGPGAPGKGGHGGDGTMGGKPGTIWLLTQNQTRRLSSGVSVPWWSNDLVQVQYGKSGKGGPGGHSTTKIASPPQEFDLANCSPFSWCQTNNTNPDHKCDCEKIMCWLGKMDTAQVDTATGNVIYTSSKIANKLYYEALTNVMSSSLDSASNAYYYCTYYHPSVCNKIFRKLGEELDKDNGKKVELRKTIQKACPDDIEWYSPKAALMLHYYAPGRYIADYSAVGAPKCYWENCPSGTGYGFTSARTGNSGRNPLEPPNVVWSPGNQNSHFYMLNPAPEPMKDPDQTSRTGTPGKIMVGPNPSLDFLNIYTTFENSNHMVVLYSLNGQRLKELQFLAVPGVENRQLDMNDLPDGVYILSVTHDRQTEVFKIVKLQK